MTSNLVPFFDNLGICTGGGSGTPACAAVEEPGRLLETAERLCGGACAAHPGD